MRFHMGFSFRLRDLKRFIIPILLGIAAYFGFGGLFGGFIQVHAYINTDTYVDFEIPVMTDEQKNQQYYADYTKEQLLEYYTNYESNDFKIVTTFEYNGEIRLFIIPVARTSLTLGFPISGQYMRAEDRYDTFYVRYVQLRRNVNLNFHQSTTFSTIEHCLSSNTCWSNAQTIENNFFDRNQLISGGFVGNLFQSSLLSNVDNNTSLEIEESDVQSYLQYIYSSQIPLYIEYNNRVNSYYYKSVVINGTTLDSGDSIPTYKELFAHYVDDLHFDNFDREIGSIYIGGFYGESAISSFVNYTGTATFFYNDINYVNNLTIDYTFFGRKDNSNYYSYDKLNCSANSTPYTITLDENLNKATIVYFPNGIQCTSDLTLYDKFYIDISNIKLDSTDSSIYNYTYTDSGSYRERMTSTSYIRPQNNFLLEKFVSLPSNFSMIVSSNKDNALLLLTDNNWIQLATINRDTNKQSIFSPYIRENGTITNTIHFGPSYNRNVLIYNLSSYYNYTSDMYLFIQDDSIVSISTSDNFTYYDSNNELNTEYIETERKVYDSSSFNLDYYFGRVNAFITNLSDDCIRFGEVVQNIYDNIPDFFQDLLFTAFIFFCSYFTYVLIKK